VRPNNFIGRLGVHHPARLVNPARLASLSTTGLACPILAFPYMEVSHMIKKFINDGVKQNNLCEADKKPSANSG